ncbi:MAG: hypothetical protein HWE16_09175 [Gammaproteobacteria bacterium]|nr:hypothetical protein [Gammaproteobacteria bacterium]
MSNKTFFITHAVIYALFAFALFFLPTKLWPLYGLSINDQYALFLSQHNSIFLGGIALFAFLFRQAPLKSPEAKKTIIGLIGTNLLGVAITLYAAIQKVFVGFGWSDPIFFALLAIWGFWQLKNNQ